MCLCREFTDPCGRCLNIFPFQKAGSRLCHFHLCVAEGIFANAAEVAAISQRDAASLYTPLLFWGLTGVSFVSLWSMSTPREREEKTECFQRPKGPSAWVPVAAPQEALPGQVCVGTPIFPIVPSLCFPGTQPVQSVCAMPGAVSSTEKGLGNMYQM